MQQHILCIRPCGPREVSKGPISLDLNYKVNFKDFFISNCAHGLTNKRYKTHRTGFSLCRPGHAPAWDLVVLGVKIFFFPKMVMWHIILKEVMSRTAYK